MRGGVRDVHLPTGGRSNSYYGEWDLSLNMDVHVQSHRSSPRKLTRPDQADPCMNRLESLPSDELSQIPLSHVQIKNINIGVALVERTKSREYTEPEAVLT